MAYTRYSTRPTFFRRRQRRSPTARQRRRRRILIGFIALFAGAFAAVRIGVGDVDQTLKELTLPLRHEDIIRQQAARRDLDPALIAAVIYQESKFEDRTSSAGARGLMQITPDTAKHIERQSGGTSFVFEDLADPDLNIRYGTFYLRELIDRYHGNEIAAIAAYNAGPTQVDAWGGPGIEFEDIAFDETRGYVQSVVGKRGEYRDKYPRELGVR